MLAGSNRMNLKNESKPSRHVIFALFLIGGTGGRSVLRQHYDAGVTNLSTYWTLYCMSMTWFSAINLLD